MILGITWASAVIQSDAADDGNDTLANLMETLRDERPATVPSDAAAATISALGRNVIHDEVSESIHQNALGFLWRLQIIGKNRGAALRKLVPRLHRAIPRLKAGQISARLRRNDQRASTLMDPRPPVCIAGFLLGWGLWQ